VLAPTVTVNRGLAALAASLALGALVTGNRSGFPGGPAATTALDIARKLRSDPQSVVVLDLRDSAAFAQFHLPRARNLPVERDGSAGAAFLVDEWLAAFDQLALPPEGQIVVGGDSATPTREVWLALRRAGHPAFYLPAMVGDWVDTIVSPVRAATEDPAELTRWSEISGLSRYFGGLPRVIDRPPLSLDSATRLALARRRGCAF
jgi:rhodanese-related sulfurtransferase